MKDLLIMQMKFKAIMKLLNLEKQKKIERDLLVRLINCKNKARRVKIRKTLIIRNNK